MNLLHRLRALFRKDGLDRELSDEMAFHLEKQIEQNVAAGMSAEEARFAALRKFGGVEQAKEECRDTWGLRFIDTLLQDLRFGLRQLRKNPGFTAVAVLTLALGIGANTAIFQLLDAVLLRSLPIAHPEELAEVRIAGGHSGMGITNGKYSQLTRPIWQVLRENHEPFSGVFAWGANGVNVGQGSDRRWLPALWVSGEFFRVLGVEAWRGRMLLPEDEGACPASRAVVSYAYWQTAMGGRDLGAGGTVLVDGQPVEVVGVTPPRFYGLAVGDNFDIALPFCQSKELRRDVFDIAIMGRLHPGWTLPRASLWLDTLSPGVFEATTPTGRSSRSIESYKRFRLAAYPASSGVSSLRAEYDSALHLLLGITGLVLLIACANLANLVLARASTREHEIAVRLALGASKSRLLRQLVVESSLLAGIGAVLGIEVAQILSRVLVRTLSTESNPVNLPIATDWRVLLFAFLAAALTCIFLGAIPALRATRSMPVGAIKSSGRGMTGSREHLSLHRLMVVTQIAVSFVLLVGALLFVRSFRKLLTFNPGMRESGITVAVLLFQPLHVPPAHYEEFKRRLLDEVRAIPGVLDVASTTNLPLLGGSWGHGVRVGPTEGESKFTWVSPDYFRAMGIPLIMGRNFNQGDTPTSQRVAVVNQTFVRWFLGGANPIGMTLRTEPEPDYPSTVYDIVGVIPDTQYNDLRGRTPPMAFAPASQFPAQGPWVLMVIHSDVAPAVVMSMVKRTVGEKHPEIVATVGDFETWIRDGMVRERLMALLSGFFGLLAAVLATVGLYGVISYLVARRRNEIGIRMALGAQRGQVIGMVLREALRLLVTGIVVGTVLSLIIGRGAGSLLFGLKPYDPLTLASAAALLFTIATLASYLPARRAAKIDPMVALRHEQGSG